MRVVSTVTRDEFISVLVERYSEANRRDRGRILDEVVALTGHHRSASTRLSRTVHAHAGLARRHGGCRCTERGGCGNDGQRCRVAHITTAAGADEGLFGCMIRKAAGRAISN